MWLVVVLDQRTTWFPYSMKMNVTRKVMCFSLWPQGLVVLGKNTMYFFDLSGITTIHPPEIFKTRLWWEQPIPFSIPYRMWLEMFLPAPMDYHLSLTFSTLNYTRQLKNICVQAPPWSILLHDEIMSSASPQYCERDLEVLGIQTEEGQQEWQKESTHTNKTPSNLPSSSNKKTWHIWGKETLTGIRVISPSEQAISTSYSYYCMNAIHPRF